MEVRFLPAALTPALTSVDQALGAPLSWPCVCVTGRWGSVTDLITRGRVARRADPSPALCPFYVEVWRPDRTPNPIGLGSIPRRRASSALRRGPPCGVIAAGSAPAFRHGTISSGCSSDRQSARFGTERPVVQVHLPRRSLLRVAQEQSARSGTSRPQVRFLPRRPNVFMLSVPVCTPLLARRAAA